MRPVEALCLWSIPCSHEGSHPPSLLQRLLLQASYTNSNTKDHLWTSIENNMCMLMTKAPPKVSLKPELLIQKMPLKQGLIQALDATDKTRGKCYNCSELVHCWRECTKQRSKGLKKVYERLQQLTAKMRCWKEGIPCLPLVTSSPKAATAAKAHKCT